MSILITQIIFGSSLIAFNTLVIHIEVFIS